jgi:hypothetical protein
VLSEHSQFRSTPENRKRNLDASGDFSRDGGGVHYRISAQVSRFGQPAAIQARRSAARQNIFRPMRMGSGILPIACQVRQVRSSTFNIAAASGAGSKSSSSLGSIDGVFVTSTD